MERPNHALFYTQPTFWADGPDIAKLRGRTDLTLQTPGIGLALAADYWLAWRNWDRRGRAGGRQNDGAPFAIASHQPDGFEDIAKASELVASGDIDDVIPRGAR